MPGSSLVAGLDGYHPCERAAPDAPDAYLELVLEPVDDGGPVLRGVVLDPGGTPVPGAQVAAAGEIVRADAEGAFAFDAAVRRRAEAVVAVAPGHLPARAEAVPGPEGPGWPELLVLRLAGEPLALAGTVVDERGEPRAGVRVYLADPTLFGLDERTPVQVENALAAVPPKRAVEESGAPLADTPTAFWSWTRTDADGRFRLDGLLERSYRLRALDPAALAVADAGPFAAGATSVELVLPAARARPVAGRVQDASGAALAGARVRSYARAYSIPSGPDRTHSWDRAGPEASADDGGRFRLAPLDAAGVWLLVSAEGYRTRRFELGAAGDLETLVLELDRRSTRYGHLQVALGDPDLADRFALQDRFGEPLPLVLRRGGYQRSRLEEELVDGLSLVLSAPEGAFELVLYRGAGEVARRAVTVVAGELAVLSF